MENNRRTTAISPAHALRSVIAGGLPIAVVRWGVQGMLSVLPLHVMITGAVLLALLAGLALLIIPDVVERVVTLFVSGHGDRPGSADRRQADE